MDKEMMVPPTQYFNQNLSFPAPKPNLEFKIPLSQLPPGSPFLASPATANSPEGLSVVLGLSRSSETPSFVKHSPQTGDSSSNRVSHTTVNLSPPSLRPRPSRGAASNVSYNLSATWSSLTKYLTESSSDDCEETDGSPDEKQQTVRRRTRRIEEESEEESSSDEYTENVSPGVKRIIRSRIGGPDGRSGKRQKKRRLEKLGRADMEVIKGEKTDPLVTERRRVVKSADRMEGLTKEGAERLVEYILGKTDWKEAAAHVGGTKSLTAEVGCEGEANKCVGLQSPSHTKSLMSITSPDGLKAHWKDALSKKVVELYLE